MTRIALVLAFLSACAGILGYARSGVPQAFPHRAHVTAGVACTTCHVKMAEDPGTVLHVPDEASCTTCHAQPHDTRPCLTCHAETGALAELADARAHLVFDHGKHLGTARGNCMRCHVGIAEGDQAMRPTMATCFKCHDDRRQARTCETCHKNLEDTRTLPATHLAHDGDWVREHGTRAAASSDACGSCHGERFCASCHGKTAPLVPSTLRFSDPFAGNLHRAGFASRHGLEAKSEPGQCATCHQPSRCLACHAERGVAGDTKRSPHPAGWLGIDNAHGREARRDPAACASCHDGAGQQLCVGCHAVGGVGGSPHPAGWSSRQPLSALPCRLCHPIGSRP